ncbi:VQ motif-containing protein 1-like [Fagus crenata]
MACASSTHEAVKVVVINTHYVETDPTSFKSAVQSLTGKDSCVAWIENSSYDAAKRKSSEPFQLQNLFCIHIATASTKCSMEMRV